MKTPNVIKLSLFVFGIILLNNCVEDDDFETPDTTISEPVLDGAKVSIASINGNFQQALADGNNFYSYQFDAASDYMEGYVISTDEGGNFFEEIILQDKLENPTAGVKLLIDVNPLFTKYQLGRKIYVKLDGLSVGLTNGVLSLGLNSGSTIAKIPTFQEDEFMFRSAETGVLVPLEVDINEFGNDLENLYLKLNNVQFNKNDVINGNSTTFAAEPADDFDGERILESCASGFTTILSTSTFSDFKSLNLPSNSGSITGILSRNFRDEIFVLNINSPDDVSFTINDRCDPTELVCGLAPTTGSVNLFSDDFESQRTNTLISGNGWTNFIEAGTEGWEAYRQSGANSSQGISARVSSRNSGDESTIAWLITPEIDLNINAGVTLNFETSNSFSNGSMMQVLFSRDWNGMSDGITSATWGVVTDAYITQDGDFFGDWFDSGNVDLSCETGKIHIAFKYVGNGREEFDGTYELDFVTIDAQ